MSEKEVEGQLDKLLINFNTIYLYYTPSTNTKLKALSNNASKKGNCRGIPDRIYFDNDILIIFECKPSDLTKAKNDLKLYYEKVKDKLLNAEYTTFYVAVVKDNYEIYDSNFTKQEFILEPVNFGVNVENLFIYTKENMNTAIEGIHNYIRNYTRINNDDKSFFIACILISLKKKSFCEIIDNYDTKEYIYDLMRQNLLDFKIDISVFEFLRNDINNTHFFNLIKMIRKINTDEIDLLNYFYSEFVKYSNKDSKNLGIVLTPPHIVKLMIHMLDLNSNDIFLDLCSGTGSFPLEASKFNCKLIACEYELRLHTLLVCNFILRNLYNKDNILLKGDCFDINFKELNNSNYKITKSAINPPYGMKGEKKELDFIIKQLESVEEGGLVCAIIPVSSINNTKFLNDKKKLLEISSPQIIINTNKNLFYPNASIQCSIILLKKTPYKKSDVLFINYENDGINIEKHVGNVQSINFIKIYDDIINIINNNNIGNNNIIGNNISLKTQISYTDDWNYYNYHKLIDFSVTKKDLKEKILSLSMAQQKINSDSNLITVSNYKNYFIHELFTINSVKRTTLKYAKEHIGNVPYVSASALNNGITAMTDKITHNKYCLTIANSGSVGSCFYHTYDICATDSVYVLYLKYPFQWCSTNKIIMCYLALLIEKNKIKYNFGRACRLNKICKDFIQLPSDPRGFPIMEKILFLL